MRVLSGIQPTGRFHWGNYFGAIRQYIDLQHGNEAYYFIANLHALTTVRDPGLLRQYTLDAAIDLLALGLDPEHAVLFVQSDVPEVSELSWLLMTGTPMGLLERCHAYKDKKEKGLPADAGLFTYPVLMAADILAYDAAVVPVGADQVQHIEVCRDVAGSFNHHFGDTFVLPKAQVLDASAKVPGTDGEKMSKSYNNTIEVFEEPKAMRKKIMRITTDARPMEQPKDPATDHLYQLFALFADPAKRDEMAALYRRGGFGYGEVKKALADEAERFFAVARDRRAALAADTQRVRAILADGASRARKKAAEVLARAQQACGIMLEQLGAIEERAVNVLGIGAEITECLRIARMIERHGERFIDRVYTSPETRYCQSRKQAMQHFTAYWAAKEAVFKALGVTPGRAVRALDIELRQGKSNKLEVGLRGGMRDVIERMGVREILVTISYSRSHAIAYAMALGEPPSAEGDDV